MLISLVELNRGSEKKPTESWSKPKIGMDSKLAGGVLLEER